MSRPKKVKIAQMVSNYPYQSDFIFASFHASIFSPRYESRATPFPVKYINNDGVKRIESLRELLCIMPPLMTTELLLPYDISFEYIDLLDWLFTIADPSLLEIADISNEEAPKLGIEANNKPSVIFSYRSTAEACEKWDKLKGNKKTFNAFYGTSLENVFSILNQGLNSSFSTLTAPLFGEGLYLTNQVSAGLLFSPFTKVWKHGLLKNHRMRVIILCEVIDDSAKVRRLKTGPQPAGHDTCTYLIVKDEKYVRPKYFFVYTERDLPANRDRNVLCSPENLAGMFYVMFVFFLLLWLYLNRNYISNMLADIIYD